jgi:hypothetical protein
MSNEGIPVILFREIVSTAEVEPYICPNCDFEIDTCRCACPYCAESEICDCAIGYKKATGG